MISTSDQDKVIKTKLTLKSYGRYTIKLFPMSRILVYFSSFEYRLDL